MKITRNVIEDLLPLYVAKEVSEDTRKLVEAYLQQDTSLIPLVQQLKELHMEQIDTTLKPETELVALQKTQQMMILRSMFMAAIIALAFLCTLAFLGAAYATFFIR